MHLHLKFHENPAHFLETSKKLFEINNFEVRKKLKSVCLEIVILYVKFQKPTFNSN